MTNQDLVVSGLTGLYMRSFTRLQFKKRENRLDLHCSKVTQLTFTCSKLTIETLEHGVKYVQS